MSFRATISFPVRPVVIHGPHGQSLYVVASQSALTAEYGREKDRAVIRTTGAEWAKTAGAWAATGGNFWGTLLQQGGEAAELARRWAEEAQDVDVDGGFSAFHWAGRSEYWATRPELLAVAASIANINLAADNLAAILMAPVAADAAHVYRDQALGFKDEGAARASDAAGSASAAAAIKLQIEAVLAGIANYDNTLAQAVGGPKLVASGAAFLGTPIVDVVNDSDGGAWVKRKRSSVSVPKLGFLIVEAGLLTLRSMDSVQFPILKQWTVAGATCAAYRNGFIVYGAATGVHMIDLVTAEVLRSNATGLHRADQRPSAYDQTTATWTLVDAAKALPSSAVAAVAAWIEPGTPLDPLRHLPPPTIAAVGAGATGRSVINWDGRVSVGPSAAGAAFVSKDPRGLLVGRSTLSGAISRYRFPNYQNATFAAESTSGAALALAWTTGDTVGQVRSWDKEGRAAGTVLSGSDGVAWFDEDHPDPAKSSFGRITTKVNTGRLVGQMLLALAESTADLSAMVGQSGGALPGYGPDLVINGDFASDLSGWTAGGTQAPVWNAGKAVLPRVGSSDLAFLSQNFATINGDWLIATFDVHNFSARVRAGTGGTSVSLMVDTTFTVGTNRIFVVKATGAVTSFAFSSLSSGQSAAIDNVSFRKFNVATDRSPAAKNPVIAGTLTKKVVATGAELAWIEGFSTANFLETPARDAFNFGIGDLAHTTFFRVPAASGTKTLFECCDTGLTGGGYRLRMNASGQLVAQTTANGFAAATTLTSAASFADGKQHRAHLQRRAGVLELWVDKVLTASAASVENLSNATAVLRHGCGVDGANAATATQMALIRAGATASSPSQVRRAFDDETRMFETDAKCLLNGNDNVQATAYDASIDVLYAAKAALGTDRFKGLVRTETTTADSVNTYGGNLIVNGTFNVDANWTKGSGWSIAGGKATKSGGGSTVLGQTFAALTVGKTYRLGYTIADRTSGNVTVSISGASRSSNGSFIDFFAGGGAALNFTGASTFDGSIDDVSLQEVVVGRMTSNNHRFVEVVNGAVVITTANEVFASLPAAELRPGLLDRGAGPALYDPDEFRLDGLATSGATPLAVPIRPLDKGEDRTITLEVRGRKLDDDSVFAGYRVRFRALRAAEGPVSIVGTPAVEQLGRSAGAWVDPTVTANVTQQAPNLGLSGLASVNMEWTVKGWAA